MALDVPVTRPFVYFAPPFSLNSFPQPIFFSISVEEDLGFTDVVQCSFSNVISILPLFERGPRLSARFLAILFGWIPSENIPKQR